MPQNFEDMYNSLRRLHNSTNSAVDTLQEKIKTLNEELISAKERLGHAQDALDINKQIMRNALEEQNKIKDEYTAEIELLRAEIKELKKN
jgi:septal ring factor EnvC (AmiA/AmiB activator)